MQASELGYWNVARQAFESGLRCSPKHPIIASKLLDVLVHIGDWQALSHLLDFALRQDQHNAHALHIQAFLQKQIESVLGKRSAGGSVLQQQQSHQPLLKRRALRSDTDPAYEDAADLCIALKALTWSDLAANLKEHLSKAQSNGSAAASKVSFSLPDRTMAQQDPVDQKGVADEQSQATSSSERLNSSESAKAATLAAGASGHVSDNQLMSDGQLVSDDAKEPGKRQRFSRRLGANRWAQDTDACQSGFGKTMK